MEKVKNGYKYRKNKELIIKNTKKCKNVCSIQKKVVTLHDFSCIVEWSIGQKNTYSGGNERIMGRNREE